MTTVQAQWLTLAFVLTATGIILGFDVWVTLKFGPAASISSVFRRLLSGWPSLFVAVVFWLGLLVGHIWLPTR
jgi:hypothetical protein